MTGGAERESSPRSFLIVRLGALGDVVHAIPVVAALRHAYPGARIGWIVHPRFVGFSTVIRLARILMTTRRPARYDE